MSVRDISFHGMSKIRLVRAAVRTDLVNHFDLESTSGKPRPVPPIARARRVLRSPISHEREPSLWVNFDVGDGI